MDQTARPLQTPPAEDRREETVLPAETVVDRILDDASREPERYARETLVPEGGE